MEKKTQSTSTKKVKVNTRNRIKIELFFTKINADNSKHNDSKSTGR